MSDVCKRRGGMMERSWGRKHSGGEKNSQRDRVVAEDELSAANAEGRKVWWGRN